MLGKGRIKPYRTKSNIEHLLDIYTDNLTVYLEYDGKSNWRNKENIRRVFDVIEDIYERSGININHGKTYVTIFGRQHKKTSFCG